MDILSLDLILLLALSQSQTLYSTYYINNYTSWMFFSDYSQFLESDPERKGYRTSSKDQKFIQNSNYLTQPMLSPHHDLVYSEFTEIISKRLVSCAYPTSFRNFNPFCSLCLKFVDSVSCYTTCFINNERNYLIHKECLDKDKSYQLRNVGELVQTAVTIEEFNPQKQHKHQLGLDSRSFYIQVSFTHPINEKNFIKINKKVTLIRDHFTIAFHQLEQQAYFPNLILLPMSDYHVSVSISQIGKKSNNLKFTKYVSFRYLKDKRVNMKCEDVSLEVEIIHDAQQKSKAVELMNYKYKYPLDLFPIVRVYGLKIDIPQQFQESDDDFIVESSSNIVQQLLKENQSLSQAKSSQSPSKKKVFCKSDSTSSHQNQAQKVNLQKLLDTRGIAQFVKNNNQSRLFQQFLTNCKPQQIGLIISSVEDKLCQLIEHQYGNYMVQRLFTVCSPPQRLYILQAILPSLPELARNKQGTHTIQAFISQFTLNQEFSYVSIQIMRDFYELCRHNNATYFIQKIVKTFPLDYTIGFFHYITENLLAFALDKNAMCVIKHMMRRLRELQGQQQNYDQAIEIVRRQIIFNVTFNVDRLIMDSYGNYVIQFCYQLFDLQRCSGITERILSQFLYYSVGKFSSNVLIKCISIYWINKNVYQYLKSLKSHQIIQIFRNKDGNKVLLQMMERLQGIQLWDRIYGVLIQAQPTKFYHDRWGVCLGSRSGQVGTRLTGFPQSKKRNQYNKRY